MIPVRFLILAVIFSLSSACGTMSLPTSKDEARVEITATNVVENEVPPINKIVEEEVVPPQVVVLTTPPLNVPKPLPIEDDGSEALLVTKNPQKIILQTGSTLDEILKKNGVKSSNNSPIKEIGTNELPKLTNVEKVTLTKKLELKSVVPVVPVVEKKVLAPSEDDMKYKLAKQFYDKGKYQNSIDVLESSSHSGLKNIKLRDLLVLAYTKYARKLVAKVELIEAQTILEKAVGMAPNNMVLKEQLHGIRDVMESNNVYDKALRQFSRGKRLLAFKSFGRVLSLNPQHKKAKKYYDEIRGEVVDTHHKKALRFYRRQELSAAILEWDRLLKIDPENDLARIYKSRAVELKQKFDRL